MPTAIARQQIIDAVHAALADLPYVSAAWLGGSQSFGRHDAWSDIDLQCLAPEDREDDVFAAVEAALERLSPIHTRFRLPMPTWHGSPQAFYRLRDADAFHMLDFLVMRAPFVAEFMEPTRHGAPVVLFDRDGVLRPVPADPAVYRDKIARRLETLRRMYALFTPLARKETLRGNWIDAATSYQTFVLKPLIEALRMRHDPLRFDFGARYLPHDLPADVVERLTRLHLSGGPEALARNIADAEAWLGELLGELEATGVDLGGA